MYIAVDTGGTFMDLVYMTEDTGEIGEAKETTTVVFHNQRVTRGANGFLQIEMAGLMPLKKGYG
jgi:N-methylhydantoinase A/oxoprolinase/acetone carboxylase beta subunit